MSRTTVTELVRNFGEACRALVPSMDRAAIPWHDGQQYDSWDRISEALFESLVLEPCRHEIWAVNPGQRLEALRYGFMPSMENAFVQLRPSEEEPCRFVRLISSQCAFDHCEGVTHLGKQVVALDKADLSFVVIGANGAQLEVRDVDLRR